MDRLAIFGVVCLMLHLGVANNKNCHTITLPHNPDPGHSLQQRLVPHENQSFIEAEVEIMPLGQSIAGNIGFPIYHSDRWVGSVSVETNPRKDEDEVYLRCSGEDGEKIPARWSTTNARMVEPRMIKLQIAKSWMKVWELRGEDFILAAAKNCSVTFTHFPAIEVKVRCWSGICNQIRQCIEGTSKAPSAPSQPRVMVVLGLVLTIATVVVDA